MADVDAGDGIIGAYQEFLRSWRFQLEELEGEADGWDGLEDEMLVARIVDRLTRLEEFARRMKEGILSQIRSGDAGLLRRGVLLARVNAARFRGEFERIASRVAERMGWTIRD